MALGLLSQLKGNIKTALKGPKKNPYQLSDPNANLETLRAQNQATRQAQQAVLQPVPQPAPQPVPTPQPAQTNVMNQMTQPSGFQSTLDPNDPAAIGGQAMGNRLIPKTPEKIATETQAAQSVPSSNQAQVKEDTKRAELDRLRQQYLESLAPQGLTPEEQALNELIAQQANLAASEELGLNKIKDQPIALPFLTGQSAALQRNVAAQERALASQALPLEQRIAAEQARRQALQKQREAELGFLESDIEAQQVTPVEVGGRLVNPLTGEVVYEPPAEGKTYTLSPGAMVVDSQGNVIAKNDSTTEKTTTLGKDQIMVDSKGNIIARGVSSADLEGGSDAMTSNLVRAATTVVRDVSEALDLMDSSPAFEDDATGVVGANRRLLASKIAGTSEWEIDRLIQSVKDNIGIDTLLNIKREGSGLGQVPQSQLETLQGVLGRLEVARDPALLKRDLNDALTMYQDIISKAQQDSNEDSERQFLRQQFPGLTDQQIDQLLQDEAGFKKVGSDTKNAQGKVLALGQITGIDGSPFWRYGLDIDLKKGDPVPTPEAGEVIFVGPNAGFGNQVKIRTARGNEVWLSHLDAPDVKVGQRVSRGQIIGRGGNTGKTIPGKGGDGSHLDLTIRRPDGSFIPPREIARTLERIEGLKAIV